MIKKVVKILNEIPRVVGIIIYPIILLLIGFMLGHKDIIINVDGFCSFWNHFILAIMILILSILLKNISKDKNNYGRN